MANAKAKLGTCVYCGKIGAMTNDHIPPKTLFPKPRPSNLITVPSCLDCNKGASEDDEYFRLTITIRHDIAEHPMARELLPSVMKSLGREEARGMARSLIEAMHPIPFENKDGSIQHKQGYAVDFSRLDCVAARIAKGLYFHHYGRSLPSGSTINTYTISRLKIVDERVRSNLVSVINKLVSGEPIRIGNGVFTYWHQQASDCSDVSLWLLVFYDRFPILSVIMPQADNLRHH